MMRLLQLSNLAARCAHWLSVSMLGVALSATGCMTEVEDEEFVDEPDDVGFAQHDLSAGVESEEDGGFDDDDGTWLPVPPEGNVDLPHDSIDALFEPQPQPWDGEEGMQESGKGDHGGE